MSKCYKLIEVQLLKVYKDGTNQSIDLFEDIRVFQSSLENSFSPDVVYYQTIGAGYLHDTEELTQQTLVLKGKIRRERERELLSFLNVPNQRYRLEITKNGIKYIRFFKRGNSKNAYRNNGTANDFEMVVNCETLWLEVIVDEKIGNLIEVANPGQYGLSRYGLSQYSVLSNSLASRTTITESAETQIFWEVKAVTSANKIKITVNDKVIETKDDYAIALNKEFVYSNIPFYSKIEVDNENIARYCKISSAENVILETTLEPFVHNVLAFDGIKEIFLSFYKGRVLI